MGQIQKQTINGTILSYIGVALGFIISGLLLPKTLSTDENGLIKLLISYSSIFAQIASLGFPSAMMRLFTYFRDYSKNHHGFFLLTILVTIGGFIISIVIFFIALPYIQSKNVENSPLFVENILYVIPLIFFTVLFLMLDGYYSVLYNSVIGTFLKEVVLRIFILGSIILYYFEFIDFASFIVAYSVSNCLPSVIILISLLLKGHISLKSDFGFLSKDMIRSLVSVSGYGVFFGFTAVIILNIDSIMISSMVSLSATGIYAITFFFGALIVIPARAMRKISATILSDAWKNNDMRLVTDLYRKSCITQNVFSVLLFVGLWSNIDNVFEILPPEYLPGKYVIFFIGLMNVIEMISGVSAVIILTSKYYKYSAIFNIVFVGLAILTNFLLIPHFGITGAALASCLSVVTINIVRVWFVYLKFKIQPFNFSHILAFLTGTMVYVVSLALPKLTPFYYDILLRSAIITILFVAVIYYLKLSVDINQSIETIYYRLLKRIRK